MIYDKELRDIFMLGAIFNTFIIIFGIEWNIGWGLIFCTLLAEIIYLFYYSKRKKMKLWLLGNGVEVHLRNEDILYNTKVVTTRSGVRNMHITIETKNTYPNYYKGFIVIPYTCYPAFQEALSEIGVEIKIDPNNNENYYMCLEKVAAHRWIPNSCKIVPESKYKIWFWISLNAIMMVLGLMFSV